MAKQLEALEKKAGENSVLVSILIQLEGDETVEEVVNRSYNATECHHDFDCCGCWYANKAKVIRHMTPSNIVRLEQSFYQNV